MRVTDGRGFTAVELAAVTFVVMLLALVLLPAIASKMIAVDITPAGVRGRDIFVAITGANTEREPLGLPPLWPADRLPTIDERPDETAMVTCSNSTDYFRWLYDEQRRGDEEWRPLTTGFDYSKLAGAGVPVCVSGPLTAENNMWTIAMNVTEETSDMVPLLVTRNIDATSLASKVSDADGWKRLRFDREWSQPFGARAFVIVRKGGAVLRAREKYADYRTVYQRQAFNANVDATGQTNALPLRYLTPTHTVTPGQQVYEQGAVREAQESRRVRAGFRREFKSLRRDVFPVLACLAITYLISMGVFGLQIQKVGSIRNFVHGLVYGVFHFAATAGWTWFLFSIALSGGAVCKELLALAVLSYSAGVMLAACWRWPDASVCQRTMKFMVASPVIAMGSLILLLLFSVLGRAA